MHGYRYVLCSRIVYACMHTYGMCVDAFTCIRAHVVCSNGQRKTRSEVLPSSWRKRRLLHLSSCALGVRSWDLVLHLNLHLPMMLK